jgi:hypothetical protein
MDRSILLYSQVNVKVTTNEENSLYKLRVVSSVLYKQIEEFKMISIKLSKGEKSYLYYDNTKIDN